MTQTTYTTVSAISIVTGETATTTIDHDRLDMAIRGATICLQHWQGEDDTELVADAMARLDRLQRLAAGETGVYGCIEAVSADIDGAIDWLDEDTTMTNTTKTLWGGYYYETDGQTYWKTGENWDTDRVEISEAEYNEAMADRQDYYDHRDIYDNDEQLLWDIETEAAIEEETGHSMTSEVETDTTNPTTREQLVASLETEKDPIGAVVAYIRDEMSGLVRHDLDAKNEGWDPYKDPERGNVWQEAVRILSEAAGVEDIFDVDDIDDAWVDLWDDLFDAVSNLLLDDESRL